MNDSERRQKLRALAPLLKPHGFRVEREQLMTISGTTVWIGDNGTIVVAFKDSGGAPTTLQLDGPSVLVQVAVVVMLHNLHNPQRRKGRT